MELTATSTAPPSILRRLGALCRGDANLVEGWLSARTSAGLWTCALAVLLCGGLYGATVGFWRAPEMAFFVALKLPLLIYAVLIANGLINGMFAQLLGSGLSFRQSLVMSLASFTTVSLILGALSPVTLFLALNAPSPNEPDAHRWHQALMLIHTMLIAYAGIVGNFKAYQLLVRFTGRPRAAKRTFFAWLAVNLFVGAQLSYTLRPFFGNPAKEVRFLREHAFNGSFYEVILQAFHSLIP